jgi:outer membrane protein
MEKWVDDAQLNSLQLAIAQAGAGNRERSGAQHGRHIPGGLGYSNNQSNGSSFGVGGGNTTRAWACN